VISQLALGYGSRGFGKSQTSEVESMKGRRKKTKTLPTKDLSKGQCFTQ
jgi:hypothetical protein